MRAGLLFLSLTALGTAPVSAQTHVVVITGLAGEPRYAQSFHEWATSLTRAAHERWGLPKSDIVYLADEVERAPEAIDDRSTRENIERVLNDLGARTDPGTQIILVLIGHGSTRGGEVKFNLPGPDIDAKALDRMLEGLADRKVAVVIASSASGAFIPALSRSGRVVITATRSGRERNETVFGRFFVEAFSGDGADMNKDGRVSLLEAFEYAHAEVERLYEREGRLLTEHALLDDDGDGEGSEEPALQAEDGGLAATMYLAAGPERRPATSDPELIRLYERKTVLEEKVADLRGLKGQMEESAYERELEALLVDLALVNRQIRAAEEGSE